MQTEPLSHAAIVAQLDAPTQAGLPVHVLPVVGSTNDWCRRRHSEGSTPPFACFAEQQTRGRGRRGRSWLSAAGANITLSLLWRFALPLQRLGPLPLFVGLAIRDCLRTAGITGAQLKWPNDVLAGDGKIAGVLTESAYSDSASADMILGIGLNYAIPANAMPDDICWTDACRHLPPDSGACRNRLAGMLLRDVVAACRQFEAQPQTCLRRLQQCFSEPQWVDIHTAGGDKRTGLTKGITSEGELRVEINGVEQVFSSADVSLRSPAVTRERAVAGDH